MITVCFATAKGRSPLSWLIRRLTNSRVSHATLSTHIRGVPVILHCTVGGVQLTLRNRFEAHSKIVEEFAFNIDVADGLSAAIKELGDRYDYMGILGFAWVLFAARWLHRKIKNPLASPTAMVCTEFVLSIDRDDRIPEWRELDAERTTAEDLLECCQRGSSFRRLSGKEP